MAIVAKPGLLSKQGARKKQGVLCLLMMVVSGAWSCAEFHGTLTIFELLSNGCEAVEATIHLERRARSLVYQEQRRPLFPFGRIRLRPLFNLRL